MGSSSSSSALVLSLRFFSVVSEENKPMSRLSRPRKSHFRELVSQSSDFEARIGCAALFWPKKMCTG